MISAFVAIPFVWGRRRFKTPLVTASPRQARELCLTMAAICRIAGGVLMLLVGAAIGAGGIQLWRGGPESWPDIIANETTVRRTSGGMIVMAAVFSLPALQQQSTCLGADGPPRPRR